MKEKHFKICKRLMVFFNSLFLLGGLALLGVGLWIILDFDSFVAILNFNNLLFIHSSYIAVGIGGITILLSLCGCVGAWKENTCFLGLFIAVIMLFLIGEITALILAFFFTTDLSQVLSSMSLASIKTKYGDSSPLGMTATKAWDFTHTAFSCCGFNNGSDFNGSKFDSTTATIQPWPLTCCVQNSAGGYVNVTECLSSSLVSPTNSNANRGCYEFLKSRVLHYATVVASVLGGAVLIQILAVSFASCLTSNIRRKRRVNAQP